MDTEGRVSEPLECGHHWMLWGTLVCIKDQGSLRAWDSFPRSLKGSRPAFAEAATRRQV